MVVVEIVQVYLFFLEVINNAAVIKIFSDKASFFDKKMNIVDDVKCGVIISSAGKRTKPIPRMDFPVTQFSFRTQTLAIYPVVDQCESIGRSEGVVQLRKCLVLYSGVEIDGLFEPCNGLRYITVFNEPMLIVHYCSE